MYNYSMEGLIIHVGWEYFLGIMAALIGVAWYSSSRFTAIETSMKWVKETLGELKVNADNSRNPVFMSQSPINLNSLGQEWLSESGMKKYVEQNKEALYESCSNMLQTNPYEVQKHIFQLFDRLNFKQTDEDHFKEFAFNKGTTMNVLRRIGAIYFRNLCLERFGMSRDEIDKHDPEKNPLAG
jgi:hypothetical protein